MQIWHLLWRIFERGHGISLRVRRSAAESVAHALFHILHQMRMAGPIMAHLSGCACGNRSRAARRMICPRPAAHDLRNCVRWTSIRRGLLGPQKALTRI